MYPKLYLGYVPATAHDRCVLRERALDLYELLSAAREPEPTYILLNFAVGAQTAEDPIELLLLRPGAVIVGAIREYPGPIDVRPGDGWIQRATGEVIRDQHGHTPLQRIKAQRDAVRERLDATAAQVGAAPEGSPFARTIGALICSPHTHPDSSISLDVDEHRKLLKILGMDELPGLAAMVRTGVQLSEQSMQAIVADLFAGRLWHDGERFLFDLAPSRFQLRLLAAAGGEERVLPLMEGENVVGRRRVARRHEHRVTLTGDDLISSDHAHLICDDDERVILRDTSKNGTWIAPPGEPERRVSTGEHAVLPGTLLRMGITQMRIERTGTPDEGAGTTS